MNRPRSVARPGQLPQSENTGNKAVRALAWKAQVRLSERYRLKCGLTVLK